ncbi:4-(cytidine 5'-diphospho)-2-C-methyl-D-erythritol kinase [Herbaspirillum sp. AP02]|uniref:4-(cytidine 5'-diphospho)-2-C-methyl-D-erythritol kinase n=1 Tax=unclassified Herbaspirillum TaxID=2624150 RepID=UPI0015DB03AD|nr:MULTISPECIES: 4-(cytidine 5'-diphospho)-2-C-methyl-D-erythritol kinase [unclassified Herbaspirillum]MBG7622469.1 4-(cytidine 5'-diphospho)-2-C-methyl-D-erythritol kinase [Herbaspirillum sp. AP02]NZD70161.1 4-(cytidine 5'-diphospho)-2-C-methyl-D-erythritol kinase [Herbaspirillum sp. AP21]
MTTTLTACPAPAKLNLFLHVTGRRPDGYHLLQSAFQLIDRCDTLDFALRDDGRIVRTNEVPGVPAESDLVIRAAHLLREASGKPHLGADITVHKILPMGGGVGGGSSDAATTLMVLNHLWNCGYNRASLMEMGLKLGADVPFFLFGRNAFAEGVGEELVALRTADCWFVVIEPGVSVPTSLIFSSKLLTRDTEPVRITDFPDATKQIASSFGKNDLEMVATAHFPEVAAAVEWLSNFGNARMTGSGACVFCAFEHEHQADEVLKQLPSRWIGWKAKAMQEHPLAHLVQS